MTKAELFELIKKHSINYTSEWIIRDAIETYLSVNKPGAYGALQLTEEKKLELILKKFHGHTKEQWENELVKEYPYCEIPHLVDMVWQAAQMNTH